MSLKRVLTKDGSVKWLVDFYTKGRGSKRIKKRFDSKADAQAYLDEFTARKIERKKMGYGVRDFEETTFAEEARYWIEHRSKEFSFGHKKRVLAVLEELLPEFGRLSPIRIQPELLSDYQNRQLARGLTPATVNRKTEVVTAILSFSVKHRRLPYSPTAGFRKLRETAKGVSFWERHEAEAFLEFTDAKYPRGSRYRWLYVAYLTALNTAVRAGELWGLQPQDIVHDGEMLYIQRQYDRVKGDFGGLKWNTPPRHVPCNGVLSEELRALVASGNIPRTKTIFQSATGDPICHDHIKGRFTADIKAAGLRRIRFHDMRHTAATLMIAGGLDVNTVKGICGHKSLLTTMMYAHMLGGAVRQAAKTFSILARPSTTGSFDPPPVDQAMSAEPSSAPPAPAESASEPQPVPALKLPGARPRLFLVR